MPIPVKCKCGKQISAPDKLAGKRAKCPSCGEALSIPGGSSKPASTGSAIPVKCKCGKSFAAPAKLAGKTVKCPGCQNPLKVPKGAGQGAAKSDSGLTAKCEGCGKSFKAPAKLAGKKVGCPGCKQPVQIPGRGLAAPKSAAVAPATSSDGGIDDAAGVGSLLDEIGFQQAAAANRCPDCKEDLEPEAVLCVSCGYHLETGKKLETQTVEKKRKKTGSSVAPSMAASPKQAAKIEELVGKRKLLGTCFLLLIVNALAGGALGGMIVATTQANAGSMGVEEMIAMVTAKYGTAYVALRLFGLVIYLLIPFAIFRVMSHMKGQTTGIIMSLLAIIPCLNLILLIYTYFHSGSAIKSGSLS